MIIDHFYLRIFLSFSFHKCDEKDSLVSYVI